MRFFEAQERARKQTQKLIWCYALLVLGMSLLMGWLAYKLSLNNGFFEEVFGTGPHPQSVRELVAFDLSVAVTLLTFVSIILASAFRMVQLSAHGGIKVAEMSGGEQVSLHTKDPGERQLLNLVEEMAIASGMPVPAVFILKNESSINAFAAGYDISDAAIAVTEGTLKSLNRDEIQGVVAHEFGHLKNADTKLNLRLMGLAFGFTFLSSIGRNLFRLRSRDKSFPIVIVGAGIFIIGQIGYLFGKILKASISRQREFHADASAVQFTRNPEGLLGALVKISNLGDVNVVSNPKAQEVSHMFLVNGFISWWGGAFATHPPLEERMKALNPKKTFRTSAKPRTQVHLSDDSLTSGFTSPTPAPVYQVVNPTWAYHLCVSLSSEEVQRQQHQLLEALGVSVRVPPNDMSRIQVLSKVIQYFKSSDDNREKFLDTMKKLIEMDKKVCVQELLIYSILKESLFPKKHNILKGIKASHAQVEISLLKDLLKEGFRTSVKPKVIHNSIRVLKDLVPIDKEQFLLECRAIIMADGKEEPHEAEIYAFLCVALEVPWKL